ncbi:hypothetical protein ABKV19_022619 [Rosa sericea]
MGREREMEVRGDHHEDDTTKALYEAAVAGSVSSFETLIQKDPLILDEVSLTHFSETPLHISALLGDIDFTKAILTHNWRLATVRDSLRRLPLLLAAAEGQKEIVQALLKAYPAACLFPDQYGRIPLHYAAMRGHAEVLVELMHTMPKSVMLRVLDRGDTVFHLCVTYNQLECLKLLVKEVGDNRDLLNARAGCDGRMTILELAVMLRQTETIKYLLSLPVVREEAKKDGKKGRKSENKVNEKCCNSGTWVEEKRGMLMVVATMISTMTFQATINPPGGFWQEMNTNSTFDGATICSATKPCVAGTAVSSYIHRDYFNNFQTYNAICFLFSLSITLLLISGFPLRKRVLVWLLSIVMCLTLTFLALTFSEGAKMVVPKSVDSEYTTAIRIVGSVTLFWVPLLGLVALYNAIRLLIWLVKLLWRIIFPKKEVTINNNANPHQPPISPHDNSSYV